MVYLKRLAIIVGLLMFSIWIFSPPKPVLTPERQKYYQDLKKKEQEETNNILREWGFTEEDIKNASMR